jgi:hypothetical protein
MKHKKHTRKRGTAKRASKFHFKSILGQRSMGGYSALKYVGLLLLGAGIVGLSAGVIYMQSRGSTIKQPLAAFSNSPETPNTSQLAILTNNSRKTQSLPELETDEALTRVAEARLRDMVAFQYYSHQNLGGKYYYDLFPEYGFMSGYSCENLAIEFSLEAKKYFDGWMASNQGHKECMLNKQVTKVGYASGTYSKATSKGLNDTAYLVVAIYAAPPFTKVGQ